MYVSPSLSGLAVFDQHVNELLDGKRFKKDALAELMVPGCLIDLGYDPVKIGSLEGKARRALEKAAYMHAHELITTSRNRCKC